ncbi:MAG: molecular chaperone [Lachnospiraceae bacterium]|nr:molecular chaperone [Lachnospiraceae bacterium]
MRRLTKAERETILLTSEAGDTWDIYTFNSSLKKRLQQFAAQHPDLCILKQEDKELGSVTYVIQKSRVSIRLIAPYSEERRRAVSAHAKEHGFGSQSP